MIEFFLEIIGTFRRFRWSEWINKNGARSVKFFRAQFEIYLLERNSNIIEIEINLIFSWDWWQVFLSTSFLTSWSRAFLTLFLHTWNVSTNDNSQSSILNLYHELISNLKKSFNWNDSCSPRKNLFSNGNLLSVDINLNY